jgi:hypothetical protein
MYFTASLFCHALVLYNKYYKYKTIIRIKKNYNDLVNPKNEITI